MRVVRRSDPAATERILRALPGWFGIEDAVRSYVRDAADLPSYLAVVDEDVVGVALTRQHFPESTEVHLLAVDPARHRSGAGRALVDAVAAEVADAGGRLLVVHTVGPSFDSQEYAATREFYRACGFLPVQEFAGIDWDGPTLVLVRPLS